MDFRSLPRRELQVLCKQNKIPANMTNIAMADALQTLPMVEGLDDIQKFLSPNKESMMSPELPRTSRRTSVRRRAVEDEIAGNSTRTRRGTARVSTIKKMELECEEGGKQRDNEEILDSLAAQGSPLPRSRRVTARVLESMRLDTKEDVGEKQEGKEKVLLETPAACTDRRTRSAAKGLSKKEDGEKEEETKTSRYRTRLSSRKQMGEATVETVSARPRTRRTRASAAVKMVALVQEEEKQEIEVQNGEEAGEAVEETVTENPIEGAKIDDETKLPNQILEDGEERDARQDNGQESLIRGLVITQNDQEIKQSTGEVEISIEDDEKPMAEINEPIEQSTREEEISIDDDEIPMAEINETIEQSSGEAEISIEDDEKPMDEINEPIEQSSGEAEISIEDDEKPMAEINEPIKQSTGEAEISIEDDEEPNQKAEEEEEFKIPDPQVSDEVTEEIKDSIIPMSENQDLAPETPAIIDQSPNSSFTSEKEEENLDLNLRLAGITLDEFKQSDDDLQVKQGTEIKSSPNRQTNHEIQNIIETLNVESPSDINGCAVDDFSFSEIQSTTMETILQDTAVSSPPTCEIISSEATSLDGIYREESENEKASGLTGLTGGDPPVDVRAEKQNQEKTKDLHELSLRKLRTLLKDSINKNNNNVEGKRSALANLNENQL